MLLTLNDRDVKQNAEHDTLADIAKSSFTIRRLVSRGEHDRANEQARFITYMLDSDGLLLVDQRFAECQRIHFQP